MISFARPVLCACFLFFPQFTFAQEATENPVVISESGTAYLRSVRLRGIDTDVAYFDPSGPPPSLQTNKTPQTPPGWGRRGQDGSTSGGIDMPTILISAAILIAIAYVFARFGGGLSVSLGSAAGNAERGRGGRARNLGPVMNVGPGSLDSILRIADRRAAVIRLAQSALMVAASADGLLLQSSWTARDVLRNLPKDQSNLGALRNLVHASERVHFGGRDMGEDEFLAHVDGVRPLFSGATA